MTFSEEAAELHRLEAVAVSLGLGEAAFERILREVTTWAHAVGTAPADTLAAIRGRIHQAACMALPEGCETGRAMADAVG